VNPWTPLLAATFGWACAVVLARAILLRGVDSVTLVPLRMTIALIALLVISAAWGRFRVRSRRAWARGAILGVISMAIPNMVMTHALTYLPVSLGGLLIALIPLTTAIAAHFVVDDERFQPTAIPGMLLALIGCAILVGLGADSLEGVTNVWQGVAFSLTGVVFAGLGGALTRRFALDVPAEELVIPQMLTGTTALLMVVPLAFGFNLGAVDVTSAWLILLIGLVGTTLPFAAFIVAAAINPAWRLGLTGYTVPVLAVAMAIVFLGERPTLTVAAGAVLIVTGVVMADKASSRSRLPGTLTPS
jgi:drug/metabolite transporter (DMT)-like permease